MTYVRERGMIRLEKHEDLEYKIEKYGEIKLDPISRICSGIKVPWHC